MKILSSKLLCRKDRGPANGVPMIGRVRRLSLAPIGGEGWGEGASGVIPRSFLQSTLKPVCRLSKSKLALSAFTLTELLAVIVMVSILAMILLSALGSAKSSALVVNCTSNYRQWGVLAGVYATDNRQYLPGTDLKASGGAGNIWDINPTFVPVMQKYGLTVQMWFCPARPGEIAGAASFNNNLPIVTPADLTNYVANLAGTPGLAVMNHNLWVSRVIPGPANTPVPNPPIGFTESSAPAAQPNVGWPSKTTDRASKLIPFLSDSCFSGYGTTGNTLLSNINITGASNFSKADKYSGHVYGGRLINVNLVFADGSVIQHNLSQIQCVYDNVGQNACWFY
jgi:hypothetical protein